MWLSARRDNHRILVLERDSKGLIQFQPAHFVNQWLSNLSVHQKHREGLSKQHRFLGPIPRMLGLGGSWEFLPLTSPQVMLVFFVGPETTLLRTPGVKRALQKEVILRR